ncbi:MAG: zonular occludens toxin domain-containing protein [Lachnospiraceae bacterium]
MISLYTGTPGSGKSLHIAKKIFIRLGLGKRVMATFPVNTSMIKKKKGEFIYLNEKELNPKYLISFARIHHKKGVEGQTLLIIDEAQRLFNSREWNIEGRKEWNEFFQLHRHYGYNIVLVTQYDRLLDRQTRAMVEYEVIHRKISNFGFKGMLLALLFRGSLFIAVTQWYCLKEKTGSEMFSYKKKYSKFYDSYLDYTDEIEEEEEKKKIEEEKIKKIELQKRLKFERDMAELL